MKTEKITFGGLRYPAQNIERIIEVCDCGQWERNVSEPVQKLDDGLAINGCCGGGCFVITKIEYCPFCGKRVFDAPFSQKGARNGGG